MADRAAASDDAAAKQPYMGLDGHVGTREQGERYENGEAVSAMIPGTTTGSILATVAGGNDVQRMRAFGALGKPCRAFWSSETLSSPSFSLSMT